MSKTNKDQIKERYKYIVDENLFYDTKRRCYFNSETMLAKLHYINYAAKDSSTMPQNLLDELKLIGKTKAETVRKKGRPLKAG